MYAVYGEVNMRKEIFKTVAIVVTILFIGIAFQPAVSTNELKGEGAKPKECLFESVVDITNDPEIEEFFKQSVGERIDYNINVRPLFFKILLTKPGIVTSIIFNRPTESFNYLESAYDLGIDTVKILGEDKSIELFLSIKEKNPEIIEDLQSLLLNNEDLNEKITQLELLNNLPKSDFPFATNPVLCAAFTTLTIYFMINAITVYNLALVFGEGSPIYDFLLTIVVETLMNMALVNAAIADIFGCWDDYPGPS